MRHKDRSESKPCTAVLYRLLRKNCEALSPQLNLGEGEGLRLRGRGPQHRRRLDTGTNDQPEDVRVGRRGLDDQTDGRSEGPQRDGQTLEDGPLARGALIGEPVAAEQGLVDGRLLLDLADVLEDHVSRRPDGNFAVVGGKGARGLDPGSESQDFAVEMESQKSAFSGQPALKKSLTRELCLPASSFVERAGTGPRRTLIFRIRPIVTGPTVGQYFVMMPRWPLEDGKGERRELRRALEQGTTTRPPTGSAASPGPTRPTANGAAITRWE